MKDGWATRRLGEVCDFIGRGVAPKYVNEGGVVVVNQRCVREHAIDFSQARRHNLASRRVPAERFIRLGDVLVNSTGVGTLGRVAQVKSAPPEPSTVDTHVTIVRPKPGLFADDFFGYAVVALEQELEAAGEGSGGQTELSRTALKERFKVTFPRDLSEKERIVRILDEALAGVEAAKDSLTEAHDRIGGLIDSYMSECLSPRPEWSLKTLPEIALRFGRGRSKHRPRNDPALYGGPYPFVQTGDVRVADHILTVAEASYSDDGLAQSRLWPEGTVCITIAANIAETAILGFPACFPDSVIGLIPDPQVADSEYLEYVLSDRRHRIQALGQGSAQDNINLRTFENLEFAFPPVDLQKSIAEQITQARAALSSMRNVITQRLDLLAELRGSLLNLALNGGL